MENLQLVLPEIFLSLSIMFLLIFGVLEEEIEGIALGKIIDVVLPENVVICEPSKLKIKLLKYNKFTHH